VTECTVLPVKTWPHLMMRAVASMALRDTFPQEMVREVAILAPAAERTKQHAD
jgi:hypothetical protein